MNDFVGCYSLVEHFPIIFFATFQFLFVGETMEKGLKLSFMQNTYTCDLIKYYK